MGNSLLATLSSLQDASRYKELHWNGNFEEYLEIVREDPAVTRTAFQRLYDMIVADGCIEYMSKREKLVHYNFFDDLHNGGKNAIFGIDKSLMELVKKFHSAAQGYGTERRILLLHGPVGTAKSTIARLLKLGLERYTRVLGGRLYTYYWYIDGERLDCPMHEEPLNLIPRELREGFIKDMGLEEKISIEGESCPLCRFMFDDLLERYEGNVNKVLEHVQVYRLLFSEKDRIGIGTFQPRDEKNQDATELTGDINYRKIAIYGSDADPRAFDLNGEFPIANRGLIEFIEILKLEVAFLYDLLTASQEKCIKPKKFAHTFIDEVILGHTNEAEYKRLVANQFMEALRDRTVKVDIPYVLRLSDELSIYQRDYNKERVRGKHIAPHTLELGAMWAVLTRLETPKHPNTSLVQKMRLYNGEMLEGFTEDTVIEIQAEATREGMDGISPRFIQDRLSNILVADADCGCINPFMLLREIDRGLEHHSLITSEDQRAKYRELLSLVQTEFDQIAMKEVQRAITADEGAIRILFTNYIDNLKAYIAKEKVRNPVTGKDEPANERLMREIEERIGIAESRKDDFRREIMNFIASMAISGKQFTWESNTRLRDALELTLFERQKDTIKISALVSSVVDDETQKKLEIVKTRMIENMGYCRVCAADVLNYVSTIFARGDTARKE